MNRQNPIFGFKELHINNVGVIDNLKVKLNHRSILGICAGNGVGKTTILESMSLVGHLPCFPIFDCKTRVISDSLLNKKIPLDGSFDYDYYNEILNLENSQSKTYGDLSEYCRPSAGSKYGQIQYKMFDKIGDTDLEYEFTILIHSRKMTDTYPPRLTDILSRGNLDQKSHQAPYFSDDRYLCHCGIVLFDSDFKIGEISLHTLIGSIARGRLFNIFNSNEKSFELVPIDSGASENTMKPRSVTYINTDLNDFGRGNDLRESPKDLSQDFGSEMIDRLRIEFNDDNQFAYLKLLRTVCQDILETPFTYYSDRYVIPADFHIRTMQKNGSKATINVQRLDDSKPHNIDFMSAGENEVFFVSLMVINFTRNELTGPSIILLDEPDLHISNFARMRFFIEIMKLTLKPEARQVVIATHSHALIDALLSLKFCLRETIQVVFRTISRENSKDLFLKSEYDRVFVHHMRTIDGSTWFFPRIWRQVKARYLVELDRTKSAVKDVVQNTMVASAIIYGLISSFLMSALVSIVTAVLTGFNDILSVDLFAKVGITKPSELHSTFGEVLLYSSVVVLILSICLGKLRRRASNKQKARIEKAKDRLKEQDG